MWEWLLSRPELEFALKLALSLVAGLAIGVERQYRGKPAGMRTHSLVIGGSMLFTVVSALADPASPARISAQIVTGIGFLGAGAILHREGGIVANLTTAAEIWLSAAIGVCIGLGWYGLALLSVGFAVLVTRLPRFRKQGRGGRAESD
jgi:putative Mg2+ transporter-C (MgtC) family protein